MRVAFLILALVVAGCRRDEPPAPTAEQSEQLNESENMLNALANEEGPEQSPGPSNSTN